MKPRRVRQVSSASAPPGPVAPRKQGTDEPSRSHDDRESDPTRPELRIRPDFWLPAGSIHPWGWKGAPRDQDKASEVDHGRVQHQHGRSRNPREPRVWSRDETNRRVWSQRAFVRVLGVL